MVLSLRGVYCDDPNRLPPDITLSAMHDICIDCLVEKSGISVTRCRLVRDFPCLPLELSGLIDGGGYSVGGRDDNEKRRIVAQTRVPGFSVSQVARRYDENANLVLKWLRDPRFTRRAMEDCAASFLPVEVVAAETSPRKGGVIDVDAAARRPGSRSRFRPDIG
jgi:transposase